MNVCVYVSLWLPLWLQSQIQLSMTVGLAIVLCLPTLLPIQLCTWWPQEKQKLLALCAWLAGRLCLTTYVVHIRIQGLLAVRMNGGVLTSQRQPSQIFWVYSTLLSQVKGLADLVPEGWHSLVRTPGKLCPGQGEGCQALASGQGEGGQSSGRCRLCWPTAFCSVVLKTQERTRYD